MQKLILLFVFIISYFQIVFAQQISDSIVKNTSPKEMLCCGHKEGYFTKVENPATFPGGIDGWKNYVNRNVHYPPKAQKKKIEGVVLVFLNVDTLGNVSGVRALNNNERKLKIYKTTIIIEQDGKFIRQSKLPQNNPGFGLEEEAERLIVEGPKWIPAEQNGKKVSYNKFVQEVSFTLSK